MKESAMKKKTYIAPSCLVIEMACTQMLALSPNYEIGDKDQLSNRQDVQGWDSSAWTESPEEE